MGEVVHLDERSRTPASLEMNFDDAMAHYDEVIREAGAMTDVARKKVYRTYGFNDLFFLGVFIIGRTDLVDEWLYERCREVQLQPDGMLDLWAREHYKSTIITFLLTIQDVLNDPEATIAIFSHTRPNAKGFMRQIKQELENNVDLKYYFDDVLYEYPQSQSPKWSEDDGITVKRQNNPKEATIEAWGLVDGMPTGKHFSHRIYDDIVTQATVTSPEMIMKVDSQLALSIDLGTAGGIERYIGTRYAEFDSYQSLIDKGVLKTRIHPACPFEVVEGEEGKQFKIYFEQAVFRTPEILKDKFKKQGDYIFACQQLQDPRGDITKKFSLTWLRWWDADTSRNQNLCIIVDPASGKDRQRKGCDNDYTSMLVLGRGADDNWRLHDGIRERLGLSERADALMELHKLYQPKHVFYEDYGMQADIEHIEYVQNVQTYTFDITPIGGNMSKMNRIMRLMPVFKNGRILLPRSCIRHNPQGEAYNLIKVFVSEEYNAFPVLKHDDMLDCLARIEDPEVKRLLNKPQPDTKAKSQHNIQSRAAKMRGRPVV